MKNLKLMTDEELVRLFVSNIDEAFDVLLARYKDKLYSYILHSIKNPDMADDLFQETFVKAIIHIRNGKYMDSGKFYAWLTRIAHNLIIDQYRTERTENTISSDESGLVSFENANICDTNKENESTSEQTIEEIRNLVTLLPDSQRSVVEMHYYQELTFKEISDITGVSINTALGRMRYAVLNMRRMASKRNLCFS